MDFDEDSQNTREPSCTPPLPTTDLTPIEIMKFGADVDFPSPDRMSEDNKESVENFSLVANTNLKQCESKEEVMGLQPEQDKNGDQNANEKDTSKGEPVVKLIEQHSSLGDIAAEKEKNFQDSLIKLGDSATTKELDKLPLADASKDESKEIVKFKPAKTRDKRRAKEKFREKKSKNKERIKERSKVRLKAKSKIKSKDKSKKGSGKRKRKERSSSQEDHKRRSISKLGTVRSKVEIPSTSEPKKAEESKRLSRSRERDKGKKDAVLIRQRGKSSEFVPKPFFHQGLKGQHFDPRFNRFPGKNEQFGRFGMRRQTSVTPSGTNAFPRQDRSPIILSNIKYTTSPPSISWRERIVNKVPAGKLARHVPVTPAIAALQAYDDDQNSSGSDDERPSKEKRKTIMDKSIKKKEIASTKGKKKAKSKSMKKATKDSSSSLKKKTKDKKKTEKKRKRIVTDKKKKKKTKVKKVKPAVVAAVTKDVSTNSEDGLSLPNDDEEEEEEEQIIKRIKLEKMDERDQLEFQKIEIDYSIVKQEPVTDEEKETEQAKSVQKPVSPTKEANSEKEITPDKNTTPVPEVIAQAKTDASQEEPKALEPQLTTPVKAKFSCSFLQDLNSEKDAPSSEVQKVELEDRNRKETDSPDTDDYASNWENDEFSPLITSSKPSLQTPQKENEKLHLGDEENRRRRKPATNTQKQIIPLDDLLSIQSKMKSNIGKIEQDESVKLTNEYETFMQSLSQEELTARSAQESGTKPKQSQKRRSSSSTTTSTSSSSDSSSSSSDSSSSSSDSSSSSSSSSDSESTDSSEDEEQNAILLKHKKKITKPIVPVEDIEKLANELLQPGKMLDEIEPPVEKAPLKPELVIPAHLLPKEKPLSTPSKIYNIRDDSLSQPASSQESLTNAIKPLTIERTSPIKLKLPVISKTLPTVATAALLGQEEDEPKSGDKRDEKATNDEASKPPEPAKGTDTLKEHTDSNRPARKLKDRSPRRVRDKIGSDNKRRSEERRIRSKSKDRSPTKRRSSSERDRERRKERSRTSRSPQSRRLRSPPPPARRRRSRSRSRSVSPVLLRRPPSPPEEKSPKERDRKRLRSPPYQRPPSPKDKPPNENQIDVVTSTGGSSAVFTSPNDQSPVAGYKKSLADSTISDAELENQKRKPFSESSAYNNMYSKTYGFYGPEDMVLEGSEGGDSPKRISLDDRINIVLGINGTETTSQPEAPPPLPPPPEHHYGDYQPIQTHMHETQHAQQQPYPGQFPLPPINSPRPAMMHAPHPHHYQQNYPPDYHVRPPGPVVPPGPPPQSAPYVYGQPPRPPFFHGPRGPPPPAGWQRPPHGPPMQPMQPVNPHLGVFPNNVYQGPNISTPPPPLPGDQPKTLVKQVGNMLEIVPTTVPPPPISTLPPMNTSPPTPIELPPPQTPMLLQPSPSATPASLPPSGTPILLTPKILTAEELKLRHERRLELKKKIRAERDKKRLEKKMRKEKLKMEVKRLLAETVTVAQSSSEEEFDAERHKGIIASLNKNYDRSILRTKTGSCVARKAVLFADGVAPGDESSSSGAEALRSPAKISASKQRKKIRRKRTLKTTGRKRLLDRLKLPELDLEEQVDPELERMSPPPPPPGSPPPELLQPRCVNPPPVQMIDFTDAPPMLPFRSNSSSSTPSNTPTSSGSSMPPSAYPPATPPSNGANSSAANSNQNVNSHGPPQSTSSSGGGVPLNTNSGVFRASPLPANIPPHMRPHHHGHHFHHPPPIPLPPPITPTAPGMSTGAIMKKHRREGYRGGGPLQPISNENPHTVVEQGGPNMRHSPY